jgi:hypothetical protein
MEGSAMVLPVLTLTLAVLGLPQQQIGNPHIQPPVTVDRLADQQAVAQLQAVNPRSIVLVRPGAPLEIEVGENTRICAGGRRASLGQLRVGERVRVSYDAVNGPPRANWIIILPQTGSRP